MKALQKDSLNAQIRRMSFNEQSGFRLKKFALKVTANPQGIYLQELTLHLPSTFVCIDTLSATGNLKDPHLLTSPENPVNYMGNLRASVTPADLSYFVPALTHFQDSIHIDATFRGKGRQFRCTHFYLAIPRRS